MSQKRKRSPSVAAASQEQADYFTSDVIEDRQSKFIGFYSPTLSYKELQGLHEVKSASHKIAAWRRESNQQSLTAQKRFVSGFDDDGEKYAGRKVEQALNNAAVTGSCVVARWWGGIMLGTARFEHIDSCTRGAIQSWRDSTAEQAAKKQRQAADEAERQKLAKALEARDANIAVLRSLAAQKESAVSERASVGTAEPGDLKVQSTPAPAKLVMEYQTLSLDRLRALDRARDATIAFLLKRIDQAEATAKIASAR